jgi:pimeloyl-ACP methyl ester carboxylesterase
VAPLVARLARGMEITSGSAVLAAESTGSGPDVLLVHAGVTDQRSWRHVVDALPGHRCLTYDARGYGRTTYEPEDGWSPVDDAVAVLDAYDVERAVVVACSMGGRTALDLALTRPGRVRGLVLIGTAITGAPDLEHLEPGLEDVEERYDAAYEAKDLDELNRLEAEIWLDGPFHPGRVVGPARDLFLEMNRIALEAPEPGDPRKDVDAWVSCGDVAVPTLVLIGEHDLAHTHANAAHLAEHIPGARLVDLPGVAHLPHLENDERTITEIAAFVSTL